MVASGKVITYKITAILIYVSRNQKKPKINSFQQFLWLMLANSSNSFLFVGFFSNIYIYANLVEVDGNGQIRCSSWHTKDIFQILICNYKPFDEII